MLLGIFILLGLLLIALLAGLLSLFYWIPKRMGYPGWGKILSGIAGLAFVVLAGSIVFEDQLFSKSDAEELLTEQGIELSDDFNIIKNKSSSAIGDYYHTFTLRISPKDKRTIISQIKESPDFTGPTESHEDLLYTRERHKGEKITQNYEDSTRFVRAYFRPNAEGYAPTYRKIHIDKDKNELVFEDIVE